MGGQIPADRKFKLAHFCIIRKLQQIGDLAPFLEIYVVNDPCSRVSEVNVGRGVHTKPRRLSVKVNLIDQAMFSEGIKTVINSGK